MIRVVVYSRVSTDLQAAEGISLETQLTMAKKHCEEHGWVLTDTYTDVMSGRKYKRFDVVIVYKVDRLARSARKYYELLIVFRDKDVSLFSLTQPIDTTTPTGKFLLGQMILIAEFEVDNTSERVTANMRHLAASGKWVTGPGRPSAIGTSRSTSTRRVRPSTGAQWSTRVRPSRSATSS